MLTEQPISVEQAAKGVAGDPLAKVVNNAEYVDAVGCTGLTS